MKKLTIISSILLVLIIILSACSQETTISVEEEIMGDLQKTAEQEKFKEVVKTAAAGTVVALAADAEPGETENNPIKVLFVPSDDVDFMIASGDLIEQALHDATGLYFEVSVPTSYAATIEEMCASPTDTIGFIPARGYALANQLCGVEPGLASVLHGWNVYWS